MDDVIPSCDLCGAAGACEHYPNTGKAPKKAVVFLDDLERTIDVFDDCAGAYLFVVFSVKPNHGLFVERDKSDEQVYDDRVPFDVRDGDRFFTVPPARSRLCSLHTEWGKRPVE